MLQRLSLGNLGIVVGLILAITGFIAYATDHPTLNLAGFFYGFPLLLGGLALKSSELKPIKFSQPTEPRVLTLREQQATVTQTKIRQDVMRYQYGQNMHLERALEFLELGRNDGEHPVLKGLREVATDDAYTLILEFDSPEVSFDKWQDKHEKITRYFGPNIRAELAQPQPKQVELSLIRTPDSEPADLSVGSSE